MKKISLNTSIYDLVAKYPDIVPVLFTIGFKEITKPMMINTAGRIMNLNKGAKMRGIDKGIIIEALQDAGFTVMEEENE